MIRDRRSPVIERKSGEEVRRSDLKAGTIAAAFITSIAGALIVAVIGFFVWLANIASRVTVLEEARLISETARQQIERERLDAARRVEDANRESLQRIEHEREANDRRVADDLRELRAKVYK